MKNILIFFTIIASQFLALPNNTDANDKEGKTITQTSYLLSQMCLADWERRAMQAYIEEKSEVAIWALENLVDLLSKQYKMSVGDEKYDFLTTDLILAYGRLALKFKETGNTQQYHNYIAQSLELARQRFKGEVKSEEDLLKFIQRVDANVRKPSNKGT